MSDALSIIVTAIKQVEAKIAANREENKDCLPGLRGYMSGHYCALIDVQVYLVGLRHELIKERLESQHGDNCRCLHPGDGYVCKVCGHPLCNRCNDYGQGVCVLCLRSY
jgi:hypothetical protein